MDKAQAIKFLKRAGVVVSVRTLQREVERGRLAVSYVPGPKGEQADFAEAELTRFAADRKSPTHHARAARDNGAPVAPVMADAPSHALARREPQPEVVSLLLAAMQQAGARNHIAPAVPVADKLRLTVAEAAAYAGLSQAEIERAIKAGKLKATKHGAHGARVVRRVDLEAFERKL